MPDNGNGNLSARYTNTAFPSSETNVFTHPVPTSSHQSQTTASAFLTLLRRSVVQLQGEINAFLTRKMEEDAQRPFNNNEEGQERPRKVNERFEDENYGEEVVDSDETTS